MKPTPRTDALVGEEHCEGLYQRVEEYHTLADFARDLERQLSDALDALERVRANEREACARVCDELRDEDGYEAWNTECAAAIRARKEKE